MNNSTSTKDHSLHKSRMGVLTGCRSCVQSIWVATRGHKQPQMTTCSLIALLRPERLINIEFLVSPEAKLSEIRNGRWTVPPGRTPSSATTRDNCPNSRASPHHADSRPEIDLSTMARPEQRYWRLPTRIAPTLAALLDRVAFLANSDCLRLRRN